MVKGGDDCMKRYRPNKSRDRRYFSKTAGSTNSRNLLSKSPMRGGFRL